MTHSFAKRHTELYPQPYCARLTAVPTKDASWVALGEDETKIDLTVCDKPIRVIKKLAMPNLLYPIAPLLRIGQVTPQYFFRTLSQIKDSNLSYMPGFFARASQSIPSLDEMILEGIEGYKRRPTGPDTYLDHFLRVSSRDGGQKTSQLYKSVFSTGLRLNARLAVRTAADIARRATAATRPKVVKGIIRCLCWEAINVYGYLNGRHLEHAPEPNVRYDESLPTYLCGLYDYRDRYVRKGWFEYLAKALDGTKYKTLDMLKGATECSCSEFMAMFLLFLCKIATDEEELGDKWPLTPEAVETYITDDWYSHHPLHLFCGGIRNIPIENIVDVINGAAEANMSGFNRASKLRLEQKSESGKVVDQRRCKSESALGAMTAIKKGVVTDCNWPAFLGLPMLLATVDMNPNQPIFTVEELIKNEEDGTVKVTKEARMLFRVMMHGGLDALDETNDKQERVAPDDVFEFWLKKAAAAGPAVRYRYSMFIDGGKMRYVPPLSLLCPELRHLCDETSVLNISSPAWNWLCKTTLTDTRRGQYKVVPGTDVGGLPLEGRNESLVPTEGKKSSNNVVPGARGGDTSPEEAVPLHLRDFRRRAPVEWMLRLAKDTGMIKNFTEKSLPRLPSEAKDGIVPPWRSPSEHASLSDEVLQWAAYLKQSGFDGVGADDGVFRPQHPLRRFWETFAFYVSVCEVVGDEIKVVQEVRRMIAASENKAEIPPAQVLERLRQGCLLWHALLHRQSHQMLVALSKTAAATRRVIKDRCLGKTDEDEDEDDDGDEKKAKKKKPKTHAKEPIVPTSGLDLAVLNGLLHKSLATNKEFWAEYIDSAFPGIKAPYVKKLTRLLITPELAEDMDAEAEWGGGVSVQLIDGRLQRNDAVLVPSLAAPSEVSFTRVQDTVHYIRRRAFLQCFYPIALSLGQHFQGEHIRYASRMGSMSTLGYVDVCKAAVAAAQVKPVVTMSGLVKSSVALIGTTLRLHTTEEKKKSGRGSKKAKDTIDVPTLIKEIRDIKIIEESKLHIYVAVHHEVLKALYAGGVSASRKKELQQLADALGQRLQFGPMTLEFVQVLKQQIADGQIKWEMLKKAVDLFMFKGSTFQAAIKKISNLVLNHAAERLHLVETILSGAVVNAEKQMVGSISLESGEDEDLFAALKAAYEERTADPWAAMDASPVPSLFGSTTASTPKSRQEEQTRQLSSDNSSSSSMQDDGIPVRRPTAPANDLHLELDYGDELEPEPETKAEPAEPAEAAAVGPVPASPGRVLLLKRPRDEADENETGSDSSDSPAKKRQKTAHTAEATA